MEVIEIKPTEVPDDELFFIDVENHWIYPYLKSARFENIIQGYGDNTFRPDKEINRAEAVKILLEALKVDLAVDTPAIYNDIDRDAWYMDYLNFATAKGIVNGYGDGTFRPGSNMSRAEAVKIVYMIFGVDF